MSDKSILEVTNYCKSFVDKMVLSDFNLNVAPGEIIALLGPSGSGKTTLLRSICGFINGDSGQIIISNKNVSEIIPAKRGVGMVFQSNTLFPHKNVQGNLLLGICKEKHGKSLKPRIKMTENILAEFGLSGFSKRNVSSLSGGEARRVELARTLLSEPNIILLDEPFSALDRELKFTLIDDIRKLLKEKNIATILVTHDVEEAERFADRIVFMDK